MTTIRDAKWVACGTVGCALLAATAGVVHLLLRSDPGASAAGVLIVPYVIGGAVAGAAIVLTCRRPAIGFVLLACAWTLMAHTLLLISVGAVRPPGEWRGVPWLAIWREMRWVLPIIIATNVGLIALAHWGRWRTPWWRMLGVLVTLGTAVTVASGRGLPAIAWRNSNASDTVSMRWERLVPAPLGLSVTWFASWLLVGTVRSPLTREGEHSDPTAAE